MESSHRNAGRQEHMRSSWSNLWGHVVSVLKGEPTDDNGLDGLMIAVSLPPFHPTII